jgi:rare lipoprotein A (peptidoglycan hydrolase)
MGSVRSYGGRAIDLSLAAAEEIGLTYAGVALVKVYY